MIYFKDFNGDIIPDVFIFDKFPNGETKLIVDQEKLLSGATLELKFEGNHDIINLCLAKAVLDKYKVDRFNKIFFDRTYLQMKFIPYQQQDRDFHDGSPLSVKVIANIINSLNFNVVEVWDAHSDVSVGLLDRCLNHSMEHLIKSAKIFTDMKTKIEKLSEEGSWVVVAPDQGAVKKAFNFSKAFGFDLIYASKHRDLVTGEITGTHVDYKGKDLSNNNFLIVDDMCIGGATFINIAKKIKENCIGKINLLTTHGFYTKGLEVFEGIIDEVLCLNDMRSI